MPDIIHSFLFQSNLMAAMSRASINVGKTSTVLISSVRCMEMNKPKWRIILDRWALGKADLVLTVSEAVRKKYLGREMIQQHKIKILYHSVEQRFMEEKKNGSELRTRFGIGSEEYVIGTVGRLHKDKGIKILIDAYALVLKSTHKIRLMIIGEGPEKLQCLL